MPYIGMKKIKLMDQDESTGLVKIVFEDDSKEELYLPMYEASKTEEPLDDTTLRDNQLLPVAKEILKIILQWNIRYLTDWDVLDRTIRGGLNEHKKYADEKLYGKERSQVRLQDIDKIKKEGRPHGRDNTIN